MSAQLNTLPAIRALLWERWRVMRWVIAGVFLLYALAAGRLWLQALVRTDFETSQLAFLHETVLPFLLYFGVMWLFVQHDDGRRFRFAMSRHIARLPVTASLTAWVQLAAAIAGAVAMYSLLLALDALVTWPHPFVTDHSMVVPAAIALMLVAFAHAWFTLVPGERIAIVVCLAAPFIASEGADAVRAMELPDAWLMVASVTACLSAGVFGALVHRARRTGRVEEFLLAINPMQFMRRSWRPLTPGPQHSFTALVWYEWRVWGWMLLAGVGVLSLRSIVPASVRFGLQADDAPMTSWVIVFVVAFFMGVYLPLREMGKTGTPPSTFMALRPVSTAQLAMGRLAGRASIVATAFLVIMLAETRYGMMSYMPYRLIIVTPLLLSTWVLMNALWPSVGVMLFAYLLLTLIAVFTLSVTGTPLLEPIFPAMVFESGLALLVMLWIAHKLARRGVMPWAMTFRLLGGVSIAMLLGGAAYAWSVPEMFGPWHVASAVLIGVVTAAGPIIWQVYWVHRCRHGGPPNYRGYAKA